MRLGNITFLIHKSSQLLYHFGLFLPRGLPFAVKLGVAGFSMGAAMALYSATCRVLGQYGNGNRYPINLSVAVALSGWLPCSRLSFNLTILIYH